MTSVDVSALGVIPLIECYPRDRAAIPVTQARNKLFSSVGSTSIQIFTVQRSRHDTHRVHRQRFNYQPYRD